MSLASSCIAVCAPLTAIASVLLFMMAHMLRSGNWTFEVLAAKHGWKEEEKAAVCRRGGFLYVFISLALWAVMFLQAPLYRLWNFMPWCQSQRYLEECRTREGLLAPEISRSNRMPSGGGGRVRSVPRRLSTQVGRQNEEPTEMSALDWKQEGNGPLSRTKTNRPADSGPELLETAKGFSSAIVSALSNGRRYPNFMRTLTDTATAGSAITSERTAADEGDGSSTQPQDAVSITTSSTAAKYGRVRGRCSRAPQQPASEPQGTVTIRPHIVPSTYDTLTTPNTLSAPPLLPSQQQYAHADLWSGSSKPSGAEDSDFLSDVELDSVGHYGLRQIRASSWGMQGGIAAAPSTTYRSRAGDVGGPLQREAIGSSTRGSDELASSPAAVVRGETHAPMITTLWPAATSKSSRSMSPALRPPGNRARRFPGSG
ncbi:hypothetical protein ABL78_2540 [Leptomonas seymouri]|uniref:Uncharacterized protein n=1 Tax=Leptomonas seymouri TaxID=5684 RepID=A0A0N1HZ47_LEPSE|nr:hypothetical protein ABL78_2540 [Leptomonas seymouri]|eukprot:KPI88365.1 hypothetical protein ABL78_2540 [Leptomonas seymouri]